MDTRTQEVPGYYVWEVPGKPLAVHLHLNALEGILPEVMRGFGAVPKRGAEVGGVLLGSIEPGDVTIVRVEDFEGVECDYKRGPSYLFTAEDGQNFDDACKRWQRSPSRPAFAVGYFRSHTRDGLSLTPEDIELMDEYFGEPEHIALLIKPFATKASQAGFFFRENGLFPGSTQLEFPFRRRDLTGEEPPPRRPLTERAAERAARGESRPRRRRELASQEAADSEQVNSGQVIETDSEQPDRANAAAAPAPTRMVRWMWIPVSILFLLLAAALGFQAATMMGRAAGNNPQEFNLALSVTKTGDNLSVKWNPDAPAIRLAQRGVLEIEDGGASKSVDLDPQYLQTGSITYNNVTGSVRFRLVVYLNSRSSVVESLDWRQ